MNAEAFRLSDIAVAVTRLAGRRADDPELMAFLTVLGSWPLPAFPPDEFHVYVEDQARGFSLAFQDADSVPQFRPPGTPARTPLLIGGFFYSEGKDGYRQFGGPLPCDVTWSETPAELQARLGPAKFVINHKKTGALQALRWEIEGRMLSANFKSDGTLGHVYVGIR